MTNTSQMLLQTSEIFSNLHAYPNLSRVARNVHHAANVGKGKFDTIAGVIGFQTSRLEAYAMLPASIPNAARANELLVILFGDDGLSFLELSYTEQWSVADSILRRIDDEHLGVDIDRLAGPDFLAHIREKHAAYGAMVSAMLRRDDSTTVNLNDHVRAIVDYVTKIIAHIDNDDPTSALQARVALRPLDVYRETSARRNQKLTPHLGRPQQIAQETFRLLISTVKTTLPRSPHLPKPVSNGMHEVHRPRVCRRNHTARHHSTSPRRLKPLGAGRSTFPKRFNVAITPPAHRPRQP